MTSIALLKKNITLLQNSKQEFYQIFHISLDEYFDKFAGFDLVKFDDCIIKSKSNEAMVDKVREIYGEDAVTMIHKFIGVRL